MMEIRLIAFGIARDIIAGSTLKVHMKEGATIASLKSHLVDIFPEFKKLAHLEFAIKEEYVSDETILNISDEVIIIPPVSGG